MEPQTQGPMVPPEMLRQRPKKSWLLPAGIGIAAGTVLGLLIGSAVSGGAGIAGGLTQKKIDQAVEACAIDSEGFTVMNDGSAISLNTKGKDYTDTGTSNIFAYYCMLNEVGVPETTQEKMNRTRAMDGTQSDTWDALKASWSYHPDSGVNVVIEGVN